MKNEKKKKKNHFFLFNREAQYIRLLFCIQVNPGAVPDGFLRLFDLIILPYLLYIFGQTGLSKQCRPRSEYEVWSVSTPLTHPALRTFIGSKMDLLKEKCLKFIKFVQNSRWKWNFEWTVGSTEPSRTPSESAPEISRNTWYCTLWHVCPMKTQFSLCLRLAPVSSD